MAHDPILVINAGSSSVKAAVFAADGVMLASGSVTEIAGAARMKAGAAEAPCVAPDHTAAIALLLDAFAAQGLGIATFVAAGHRVVHGGRRLTRALRITADVEAEISACAALAPLHNPPNLAGIRALARLAPDLPQIALFDTGFHATNPEVALRYALPESEHQRGIRRFGFHGISYENLSQRLPDLLGAPRPQRVLAMHLGNGASLCAIRDGQSVATTMGYSPLDGLTMGTRSGAMDGMAVLDLARAHGIEGAATLLNRASGLLALGGASDMRALHAAGTAEARFAVEHFCYWAVRHAGSMVAAMGGLDCVAFTGGIGENDAHVRAEICAGLGYLGVALDPAANAARAPRLDRDGSGIAVLVVPAEEERHIAEQTRRIMQDVHDSLK